MSTQRRLWYFISKCSQPISIQRIESDTELLSNDSSGPWYYKNSGNIFLFYTIKETDNQNVQKINLKNLRNRGFSTKLLDFQYTWYSWLRFNDLSIKEGSMDEALNNKDLFLTVLMMVNQYYQYHPQYAEEEGLEKFKGPQTFDDIKKTEISISSTNCLYSGAPVSLLLKPALTH